MEHKEDNTISDAEKVIPELKTLLEKTQKGFHDMKAKVDEQEAEIKKMREDVLTQENLDRQTEGLQKSVEGLETELKSERKEREGLETRMNERGNGASDDGKFAAKLERFNATFKAHNKNHEGVLTAEQFPDYKREIDAYIRKGAQNPDPEEIKNIRVGSDPAGGFFVTPDTSGDIVEFIHESSTMRQMANVRNIGTDRLEGKYKLGRPGASWVGETETRSESATPDGGKWEMPAHEIYAWPEISMQALEDMSNNPEAELAADVQAEFGRKEETAYFLGTGQLQPRGLLTYSAGTPANTSVVAFEVIRQTNTGAADNFHATLPGDIFFTVIGQTKAAYLNNASWTMGRTTQAATRKIKDGDGNYMWERSFQAGQPFLLLDYPIATAEDMPVIAANSLSIAFGDFRAAYTIVDRLGISTLVDPYTSTTGFIKFKTRRRVGGGVVNFEAVQLIKFAA